MLIPDNVKELRTYLETFEGDFRVYVETRRRVVGSADDTYWETVRLAVRVDNATNSLVFVPIELGDDGFPRKVY
jgi:hypothetical protein